MSIRSFTTRQILNLCAFICILSICFALFTQYVLGMRPCAWCVLQRLIILWIAVFCLFANVLRCTITQKLLTVLAAIASILGVIVAYYQYTVAQNLLSCDLTFADRFMHQITHLDTSVPWLFGIKASCFDAKATLLGVDYPIWTMLLFGLLTIVFVYSLFLSNTGHSCANRATQTDHSTPPTAS